MKKIQKMKQLLAVSLLLIMLFTTSCAGPTPKACEHVWQNATCVQPKTCSVCQVTEGEIGAHNYVDGLCLVCQSEDPVSTQLKKGKSIYAKLNAINAITEEQAEAIYDAWYFAIYKADDDDYLFNVDLAIKDFAVSVGLNTDVVKKGIDNYLDTLGQNKSSIARLTVLGMNSGATSVVLYAYENSGLNDTIEGYFAEVKGLLKEMDSNYENQTYYSVLKDYYSASVAYHDFVVSPSGSFSQLSTTLNGYTSKIVEHMQELSFVYEE